MSNWGQQPPPGPYDGHQGGYGPDPWGHPSAAPANPGWQGQNAGPPAYGQHPGVQAPYGQHPGVQAPYGQPGYGSAPGGFVPNGPAFVPQAAKPGVMPLRPQHLGDVFDAAFQTIRGNPGGSIGTVLVGSLLAAVLFTVLMVAGFTVDARSSSRSNYGPSVGLIIFLAAVPVAVLAGFAAIGGLVHVFSQAVMGRRASVGAALRVGMRRMWSMLGLSLFLSLLTLGVMVPFIIILIVVAANSSNGGATVFLAVLVGVATACALVWVFIRSSFAGHIVVMEKTGPINALSRSWKLTKGRFWRTLGINLLAQILVSVISWVFQFLLTLVLALGLGAGVAFSGDTGSDASVGVLILTGVLTVLISLLTYAFIYPFTTNVIGALYVDARIRDEGLANQLIHLPSDPMAAKVKLNEGALDFPLPGGAPMSAVSAPYGYPDAGPFSTH